ncbi:AEC family transporter [Candidatus Halobonum tyrrellensis]|uniref:Malonate transporter n=1 Tax=Candidatus Halobonum tyrrellensis G22 TaxID=1324957 RepID=V4GV97_9EURY|nr:AEC family transporter [Candidatus Halobonum tyrrellensis]ESP89086.1 malonate transporter [Candidatus Halobonum tyrrellensis G22]
MSVVSNLLYLLVLLCVGFLARRVGLVDDRRRDLLTSLAFYVALPALVFTSTASTSLETVFDPRLLVGVWAVLLAVAGVGWVVHGRKASSVRGVAVVQSYHCNLGFLGLPITAATFGGVVTAKASLVLGAGILTQVPLTLMVLSAVNDADADLRGRLREVFTNPVLAALAVGLCCAALSVHVPDAVTAGLGVVSELALPVALVAVGASLSFDGETLDLPTVGSVVFLKMALMPAVAFGVFTLLAADPSTTRAGVVMLAMPTAVSTFVYASELGGDADLASVNVFVTTLASVGTLLALFRFV